MSFISSTSICFYAALLGFSAVAPLSACQVPVFRFALERWAAADYRVAVVPGTGGLTSAEQEAVEGLKKAAETASANLAVETAATAPASSRGTTIELRYPEERGVAQPEPPIWSGPLTQDNLRNLIDSPVRQELHRRLMAGQSAVWLLIESGNAAKDDAAAAVLSDALTRAAAELKLPEGVVTPDQAQEKPASAAADPDNVLQSDVPLRIEFSVLRVGRRDLREAPLLAMLMHLEGDLQDYAGEPMAFPVFGRGRALEPLIGRGIHEDNVMEHAAYLCGACSCEVKEQNPGIDLLLAAKWVPLDVPQLELVQAVPAAAGPPAAKRKGPILIFGASALALFLGVWVLRRKA